MAENPYPPDALVVRGGECAVKYMRINAEKHHRKHQVHALSAWCVPGLDADGTARHARDQGEQYMVQPSMRAVTIKDLEDSGFIVAPDDPPPGHVAIMLSSPLSERELGALHDIFGPLLDNPMG